MSGGLQPGGECKQTLASQVLQDSFQSCDILLDRVQLLESRLVAICENVPEDRKENARGEDRTAMPGLLEDIESIRRRVVVATENINNIISRLVI